MFRNEPLLDFSMARDRAAFERALNEVDEAIRSKKLVALPIIDGKEIRTEQRIEGFDPSCPSIRIGETFYAGLPETEAALTSVNGGRNGWANTPVEKRAAILKLAAAEMRKTRHYLAALITREAGKPWKEADADVCEAIDFCEYYAEEMLRLGLPRRTQDVPGEDNTYFYQARGVAVVIAPWNFPLAIACGMTVAALVAGNTTILKPAEQTNQIAYMLAKILLRAGIPASAFAFLPGVGEIVGQRLVSDIHVDLICFTGSRNVGLSIISQAAQTVPGQRNVKRVIAEMGGKNAVIVDEDADLDEAIKGVIYSAFGYSGQKCSACSRVLVVGDAYEPFVKRLGDAAADIIIGNAKDSSTLVGPVIDGEAQARIFKVIDQAERTSTLVFKGISPKSGFFVPPTIFRDVDVQSSLWKEEVFGPVLACHQVESFEEGIKLACASEYALTGGVYSRSPKNIELARKEFKVGNLYINRGCTGAMVCRQPFGGFAMSGVGSKAGGPDYLLQFLEPRTVSENTMRRGFAPELTS